MLDSRSRLLAAALSFAFVISFGANQNLLSAPQVSAAEKDHTALRERVAQLEKKLAESIGADAAYKSELKKQRSALSENAASLQAKKDVIRRQSKQLDELKRSLEEKTASLAELKSENEALAASRDEALKAEEVSTAGMAEVSANLNRVLKLFSKTQGKLESREAGYADLTIKTRVSGDRIAELKKEVTAASEKLSVLQENLAVTRNQLKGRTDELKSKTSLLSAFNVDLMQLQSKLADNESQFAALRSDRTELVNSRDAAIQELQETTEQSKSLQEKLKKVEEKNKRLGSELNASEERFSELDDRFAELNETTKRPSSISIQQNGGGWDFTGEVPDDATKSKIEVAARKVFGDLRLHNNIVVSDRIKPAGWLNGLPSVLKILQSSSVDGLGIELNSDAIEINGAVGNPAERARITRALGNVDWSGGK